MGSTSQQRLARTAALHFLNKKDGEGLAGHFSGPNPEPIFTDAIRQGMAGFLYRHLLDAGETGGIPNAQCARLRRIYLATAAHNISRARHLAGILARLGRHRVTVVVLKGMALLETVYDDPGLRPMEDIDLWVMPENRIRLEAVLEALGYQRNPLYHGTFRKGGTILDIRTHLLDADRIRARELLIGVDQEKIFNRARPRNAKTAAALVLEPSDQVLFLCIHALKHDVSRLIWLVDILGMVCRWDEKDWDRLVKRAETTGQEKPLAYILYLLQRIFGFYLPRQGLQLLENHRFGMLERHALGRRINKNALPPWSPLVLVSTEKGLKGRLQYILETLFPRPQILRQVFSQNPGRTIPSLYLLRAAQLLSLPFSRRR